MTNYYGDVPQGQTKTVRFTLKLGGVATEPTSATLRWKDAGGVTQATVALAAWRRPTGYNSVDNPGVFEVDWAVPANQAIQTGYYPSVDWSCAAGSVTGELIPGSTFAVIATAQSVTLGGPMLCTAADVRDRVELNASGGMPGTLTATKIESMIAPNHGTVLRAFGATSMGELEGNALLTAQGACLLLSVADVLVSLFPLSEAVSRIASDYRKRAQDAMKLAQMDATDDGQSFSMGVI